MLDRVEMVLKSMAAIYLFMVTMVDIYGNVQYYLW